MASLKKTSNGTYKLSVEISADVYKALAHKAIDQETEVSELVSNAVIQTVRELVKPSAR